jgi:hypothetical protein
MPAKSAKQKRFMQAVANNPKFANKVDVPQSVGAEYTKENKMKKKMNMGGPVAGAAGARAMDPRMAMAMEARRRQAAMGGMKKGGSVKKMKAGGSVKNELEELGRVDAEKAYTKKGKGNLKSEKKRIIKNIKKNSKASSASKRADGIAQRGHTRGQMR